VLPVQRCVRCLVRTRGKQEAVEPGQSRSPLAERAAGGAAAVRGGAAAAAAAPAARERARAGPPAALRGRHRRRVGVFFQDAGARAPARRRRPAALRAAPVRRPGARLRRSPSASSRRAAGPRGARRSCRRARAWCPLSWTRCARWPSAVRALLTPPESVRGAPACGGVDLSMRDARARARLNASTCRPRSAPPRQRLESAARVQTTRRRMPS